MGELGRIHQLIIPFLGHDITINLEVVLMTWIAFAILVAVGILSTRKRGIFPRSMQMFGELFVNQFYDLTEDALDKEMAKKYGPL
ncbi:MAG: F0F1 ATP synthase subunit A, partial [Deltaproteobacteria bacterium]